MYKINFHETRTLKSHIVHRLWSLILSSTYKSFSHYKKLILWKQSVKMEKIRISELHSIIFFQSRLNTTKEHHKLAREVLCFLTQNNCCNFLHLMVFFKVNSICRQSFIILFRSEKKRNTMREWISFFKDKIYTKFLVIIQDSDF